MLVFKQKISFHDMVQDLFVYSIFKDFRKVRKNGNRPVVNNVSVGTFFIDRNNLSTLQRVWKGTVLKAVVNHDRKGRGKIAEIKVDKSKRNRVDATFATQFREQFHNNRSINSLKN